MNVKVKKETVIRTAVLILALVNQVLVIFGAAPLPIGSEELTQVISLCFTVGASLWSWWKNNSYTENAVKADEYLKELKKCGKNLY